MSEVFVAGPIDFREVETIVDYRLRLRDALESRGLTPVDQYSELLERLADAGTAAEEVAAVLDDLDSLPESPYLEAIREAVAETSVAAVVESPSLVPAHARPETVADIVDHDLSLVEGCDVFLAYLPRPSCGTMVELLHARDQGIPTVVVSDAPPLFVQYFADRIHERVDDAVDSCVDLSSPVPS